MRAALLQLTSSDQPEENLEAVLALVDQAVAGGADLVLTPEVTNCVSASRKHQHEVLKSENDDIVLAGLRNAARTKRISIVVGSLAVKTDDPDGRFANRCFVIGSDGTIRARYDKIHMFDVQISDSETYRESDGFRPGGHAVTVDVAGATLGLSICYDIRFAALYRALAKAGAQVLTVPAAFSPVTGAAHWHSLLRARAIETGCYVLAPAQTGAHPHSLGRERSTYGHSLAVSPWGDIIADAGTVTGVTFVDLDLSEVEQARRRVPALDHDRPFVVS
ncbi:carbon-nitrogen hydrolase family protein [Qingshengfaniella alkalisoli]|uniref:Carbon-nitrogen hydrolase family protein n=1 Tax=Qingshengfaniella alkalisoli TaxID=2599296 RepID=A0A5B8JBB8_9RHOB|nr:carbon-nitrogen hydrolase family protein [Qingshengfaniella alkalisoli]QDY71450.1 carbon-nitrogen hydrolase family protein [Qingshengfaniella alkalisoli]